MLTFNLMRISSPSLWAVKIFSFFLESSHPINLPLLDVWQSYISMVIKLQQHSLISVSYSNFALILGAVSFLGDSTFQLPCNGCTYLHLFPFSLASFETSQRQSLSMTTFRRDFSFSILTTTFNSLFQSLVHMKCFEIELIVFHFLLFDSNLSVVV